MIAALKPPSRRLRVDEFLSWEADGAGERWQLRDGEPERMEPATDAQGSIHALLCFLPTTHLRAGGDRRCRAVVSAGVVPRVRAEWNLLVPDIGITCAPPSSGWALPEPMALVEILSPWNEAATRANVWAYTTIPSVAEILLVSSTGVAAEVLRRRPDGAWPERPEIVGPGGELRLDGIGFAAPLLAAYATTTLAGGGAG